MRLKEFKHVNPKKLDEKLANWVGDYGAAFLKQMGNRITGDTEGEMSIADKTHKEKFINNFLSAAYKSLNSEISSGRVDPNIQSAPDTSSASPAEPPATEPAAPSGGTSGVPKDAGAKAAGRYQAQTQTNQNINNYIRNVSAALNQETDKNKKIALTKELINFMADRKGYPEWDNALATAKAILQRNKAGGNMVRALQTGQRVMEAWTVYWINQLLEAVGLTWKDVGLTLLKENKKNGKYIIAETKYLKLNNLFEGILNEAESIEQWLNRWLPWYLRGIPMNDTHTKTLIKAVNDSYPRDKGKAAFEKLANAAFAASQGPGYGGGSAPAGGGNYGGGGAGAAGGGAGGGAAATTSASSGGNTTSAELVGIIKSQLARLKKIDAAAYSKLVKELSSGGVMAINNPNLAPEEPKARTLKTPDSSAPASAAAEPAASSPPASSAETGTGGAVATRTPDAEVGTTSATGGSTFTRPGSTTHIAASDREAKQQQTRDRIERERQARAAAQGNNRRPRLPGGNSGSEVAVRPNNPVVPK